MESENKSGLPEPLPDEENSEVNGGICEIKEGDHDGYDDDIFTKNHDNFSKYCLVFVLCITCVSVV